MYHSYLFMYLNMYFLMQYVKTYFLCDSHLHLYSEHGRVAFIDKKPSSLPLSPQHLLMHSSQPSIALLSLFTQEADLQSTASGLWPLGVLSLENLTTSS